MSQPMAAGVAASTHGASIEGTRRSTTSKTAVGALHPGSEGLVLIVDDDEQIRRLFASALDRVGFRTEVAANGREALAVAQREPLALVVLDVTMPGMSGLEVVRALRQREATARVPILLATGMNDADSVVRGLEAGASDFLRKPVHLAELVARARAHLRGQQAWNDAVLAEFEARSRLLGAFAHAPSGTSPEEAAAHLASELARHSGCTFVAVLRISASSTLVAVATHESGRRAPRPGLRVTPEDERYLLDRLPDGPWLEPVGSHSLHGPTLSALETVAVAPIAGDGGPTGLLLTGDGPGPIANASVRRAQLLAMTVDAASMMGTTVGRLFADQQRASEAVARLGEVLTARAFDPVFQPIIDLASGAVFAYEALTRFHDGTRPDVRFAEASAHGLGIAYEGAALDAALRAARKLPPSARVSINVSPEFVLEVGRLARLAENAPRTIMLELTEHVAIADYARLRGAIRRIGHGLEVAVDDAGAGYASMRHILELQPDYAKLDISIVRGIEADPLRQALVSGLTYFGARSGCRLIAEGVETSAEADALRALGVPFGQGFLFGRPEPI